MTPYFVNTDLELRSDNDFSDLTRALGDDVFELHRSENDGQHYASFELTPEENDQVLTNLERWCDVLERVDPTVWDSCRSKRLDVGLESGDEAPPFSFVLPPSLVGRLAALEVEVAMTLYPVSPD